MRRGRPVYFYVAPRYGPGSPADVDEYTARGVADDERGFHEHALSGIYGVEQAERAQKLGLAGIVERRVEMADCWIVVDLITNAEFIRLFPAHETTEKRRKRAFRLAAKYHLHVEGEKA